MSESFELLEQRQAWWAGISTLPGYVASIEANLFLGRVNAETRLEFEAADGGEITEELFKRAKMRALLSSSALAVNVFDAWRHAPKTGMAGALGLPGDIVSLRFEYKTTHYPIGPRSPNLDLLLTLSDGSVVAIESKFAEPFRSRRNAPVGFSEKYFPRDRSLWTEAGLPAAQGLASTYDPEQWTYLDVPQLLKHMLGLANDPQRPSALIYLWYDTGRSDARSHADEMLEFGRRVSSDRIRFLSLSYQQLFDRCRTLGDPVPGWREYISERYMRTA